jgi:hypothetical protein
MLHRGVPAVFVLLAACKSADHHPAADAGNPRPDAPADTTDAPPDASNACAHVGFDWLPWPVAGHQPHAVTVADVNGDGTPDLIVSSEGRNVDVLLGTGGGRFRPAVEYPIRTAAGFSPPVVADVNHDGKLDVIVAFSAVSVLLGNGDGTFQDEVDYTFGGDAADFAGGDVDHDGNLDIVVSAPQSGEVKVLLGRGDGTFGTAAGHATLGSPGRLALTDVSGDGKLDVIVGSTATSAVSILLGRADGTFGPHTEYGVIFPVDALAVADVSGDGIADIVTVRTTDEEFNMTVLFGDGHGAFPRRSDRHTDRFPVAVDVADVNRDGLLDIVAAADLDGSVVVWPGNGTEVPTVAPFARYTVGGFPAGVVIADVSGDGRPDLITANREGDNLTVALGNGLGAFLDVPPRGGPSAFFFLADLDRDGKLDAVGPSPTANVLVQLGNSDGTFRAAVPYPTNAPITLAVPADVNHDGNLDIVLRDQGASPPSATLSVLLGNGDGTFRPRIDQPVDLPSFRLVAVDLDGDGNADVVETHAFPDLLRVRLGNGDGTFGAATDYPLSDPPGRLAAADLDRDGHQDIVVTFGRTLEVLLGKGDGTFRPRIDQTSAIGADLPTIADVNRDGKPDLLLVTSADSIHNTVTVMLGAGDGTFATRGSYPASVFPEAMAVGDVTGDGALDVILYSSTSLAMTVLAGDGTGALEARTDYAATVGGISRIVGVEAAVAVADVTSDGKPDVLVSGGPMFVATCRP